VANAGFLWVVMFLEGYESFEEEIEKLRNEVESLKHQTQELRLFRLEDRQQINKLQRYISDKKSGTRRDHAALSQELVEFIAKRILMFKSYGRASLNYSEVLLCLKLNHSPEAYRVMKKTARLYPGWVKYKDNGNKILLSPTRSFAELVRETGGNIWSKNVYEPYE